MIDADIIELGQGLITEAEKLEAQAAKLRNLARRVYTSKTTHTVTIDGKDHIIYEVRPDNGEKYVS